MALAHTSKPIRTGCRKHAGQNLDDIPGEDGWPLVGNTLKLLRDPGQVRAAHGRRLTAGSIATMRSAGRNIALVGRRSERAGAVRPRADLLVRTGLGPDAQPAVPARADADGFRPSPRRPQVAVGRVQARTDAALCRRAERRHRRAGARMVGAAAQILRRDQAAEPRPRRGQLPRRRARRRGERINQAFVDEVQASVAPIRVPLPGTAMRKGVKAREYLVDWFKREIPKRRAGSEPRRRHGFLLAILPRHRR